MSHQLTFADSEFSSKRPARIREILISEPAWEEMTCLFALSLSITI